MKKVRFILLLGLGLSSIFAQNVGIGTAVPTEKLDIVGNLKFSGALMPAGNPGTSGQVLISQGAGNAPVWTNRPITSRCGSAGTTNYLMKWTGTSSVCNSIVYDNGSAVGIGTTTPNGKLDVNSDAANPVAISVFSGTGNSNAIFANAISASAISAVSSVNNSAVIFAVSTASVRGDGVSGLASASGGNGISGTTIANSAGNFGVYALNTYTSGTGLMARGNNAFGTYLTEGSGVAANGYHGVFAYARNTAGTGVVGVGNNNPAIIYYPNGGGGVFTGNLNGAAGYATSASNNAYGLYGEYRGGATADGCGVYGWAYPAANWGYGVYGYGGWRGVYGYSAGTGVYGADATGGNFGVFSNGNMGATGVKPFVIDHPADPANKTLRHFSIESNEVLNVYRGNVVLDKNGQATVQLPHYFHLINTNFSYVLTPIGAPAQVYILQKIDEQGKFVIAGGNPNQEISWYVYAERNDPYLQRYPEAKQVEVEKEPKIKGKYYRPELYGQPAEKGIDYFPEESSRPKAKILEVKTDNTEVKYEIKQK